jgi:2-keto-4-pentenoate hydratase/2-oxohepta-3-ene-1,7-dioic acid hydratase in catechol pathway
MKLIAFETPTGPRIGQVAGTEVNDLGSVEDFYGNLGATELAGNSPRPLKGLRLAPPVPKTARIFCVGINYPSHLEEARQAGLNGSEVPIIFGRWASTLVADGDPVPVPPREEGLDWEAELAVVIGKKTWCVTEDDALQSVFGYTAFNDLSARDKQSATIQWTLGKNADRSGPIGPVLVTADEIGDPHNLDVRLRVNGELRQRANTSEMLQNIPRVISYISDTVTLLPGDVIATGTMAGVGAAMNPPQFLRPGDLVEVEIESIGVLRTPIVGPDEYR